MRNCLLSLMVCLVITLPASLSAADAVKLKFTSPRPYQVIQREGFEPRRSSVNEPEGPALGYADVTVLAHRPDGLDGAWQFRLDVLVHGFGRSYDWRPAQAGGTEEELKWLIEVPAGGWYRLSIQCVSDGKIQAEGTLEPIGVGEVFLVAGQSYAGGANDELMKVMDPSQGVSTYDWQTKAWRIANDPPPHNGDGGSIWPPLGDMLAPTLRVPVAFVNVSVGGTSTTKWHPTGELHKRLCAVGRDIGPFRAVLWQQGESDVIEKTSAETYVRNMREIRKVASDAWDFTPPWLLAKSTLHPTVYIDPVGERRIRDAIGDLWEEQGFRPGPDTDVLGGDNRGDVGSRRHFSGIGQRRAALLWFAILWNDLHRDAKAERN